MHEKEDELKLVEGTINSHDLSIFCEWCKISAEKYTAGNNMQLLTKLRRDTSCFSPHEDGKMRATRFDALAIFALLNFYSQSVI